MSIKQITLFNGELVAVDEEDYDYLMKWKWHLTPKGYAMAYKSKGIGGILMHRLIMNAPKHMQVDHRDGNKLDNRKDNLRLCSRVQNCRNRKLNANNTSNFKGVTWDKKDKRFRAKIYVHRKTIHLGSYTEKVPAAIAYNNAATELFGEFARLNVIPGEGAMP